GVAQAVTAQVPVIAPAHPDATHSASSVPSVVTLPVSLPGGPSVWLMLAMSAVVLLHSSLLSSTMFCRKPGPADGAPALRGTPQRPPVGPVAVPFEWMLLFCSVMTSVTVRPASTPFQPFMQIRLFEMSLGELVGLPEMSASISSPLRVLRWILLLSTSVFGFSRPMKT